MTQFTPANMKRKRRNRWTIAEDMKKQYPQIKDIEFSGGFSFTESGNAWSIELKDGFTFDGASWFSEATLQDVHKSMKEVREVKNEILEG